jgi:hypothetical protein
MQFEPMTGEDYPIELQNQDNQDLYNANLVAILALEKQQYFRNCKNCGYLEGNCNHDRCTNFDIEVNPELDGCTFGEVENE